MDERLGVPMSNENTRGAYRILFVDDARSDRDLFKFLLGRGGFIVETATDGVKALELLEQRQDFDLVLCDYLMPNMNGYEFLQKVRQDPKFSHVIVIMITSDESVETKIKLLKSGANDFVHKGDSHDEIIARLKVHLNAYTAKADRKILEVASELANKINHPLVDLLRTLELLKKKVLTELPEDQQDSFLELLGSVNQQTHAITAISEDLKKIIVGARS